MGEKNIARNNLSVMDWCYVYMHVLSHLQFCVFKRRNMQCQSTLNILPYIVGHFIMIIDIWIYGL